MPAAWCEMQLFVYGTLMEPDLVQQLTGKRFRTERARLPGFRRIQEPGSYPYILASVNHAVDGLLLRDVDADALRALDRYEDEGGLYLRTKVVVESESGSCPCETYVGNASIAGRLETA
jgi:gamma-glutamylcyclotransferase (GGCT)/AIG2-like uncharacterized protein YtfP